MTEYFGYGVAPEPSVQKNQISSYRRDKSITSAGPGLLDPITPTEAFEDEQSITSNDSTLSKQRATFLSSTFTTRDAADEARKRTSVEAAPTETTALILEPNRETAEVQNSGQPLTPSDEIQCSLSSDEDEQKSWRRETGIILKSAATPTCAFLLQGSLQFVSTVFAGHIGKREFGAVALGSTIATVTGYSVLTGLATSLDTLCAQAYGSARHNLLGLYVQRMALFSFAVAIPIACIWLSGVPILHLLLPPDQTAIVHLTGRYLKIATLGLPGCILFGSGKHFVQAQGHSKAAMIVLGVTAPVNVVLHWLLIWKLQWGFIGCPVAVVVSQNLVSTLLLVYILLFVGLECWPGLSRKAFTDWSPLLNLALSGTAGFVAEHFAFGILMIATARISTTHLCAQAILMNLNIIACMLPLQISVAASTRFEYLVGISQPETAKVVARVAYFSGSTVGIFNMIVLSSLRMYIPRAFTFDAEAVSLTAQAFPISAAFQLLYTLTVQRDGTLRGLREKKTGDFVRMLVYYMIAVPFSLCTTFGLGWGLLGMWSGPVIALFVQSSTEALYVQKKRLNRV